LQHRPFALSQLDFRSAGERGRRTRTWRCRIAEVKKTRGCAHPSARFLRHEMPMLAHRISKEVRKGGAKVGLPQAAPVQRVPVSSGRLWGAGRRERSGRQPPRPSCIEAREARRRKKPCPAGLKGRNGNDDHRSVAAAACGGDTARPTVLLGNLATGHPPTRNEAGWPASWVVG